MTIPLLMVAFNIGKNVELNLLRLCFPHPTRMDKSTAPPCADEDGKDVLLMILMTDQLIK